MELHKAIKSIIETDGIEVLFDTRLVNILSDFNAFESIPASKYILRAIIADGYTRKLYAMSGWNSKSEALSRQFSTVTGFQSDYVDTIFQSIAYGLGWKSSINYVVQAKNTSTEQVTKPVSKIITIKEWKSWSDNQRNDYLNDLIEWLVDFNGRQMELEGFTFETIEDDVDDDDDFYPIYYRYIIKATLKENLKLTANIFDKKGRLKESHEIGSIKYKTFKGYKMVSGTFWCYVHPTEIGKIQIVDKL